MKISAVIPNYNGAKILKDNLPKVLEVLGDAEVILVDDASTDDSVFVVKKNFPKVKIVAREKNEGFASSVNDGVQIASGELILLLNSDVVPEKDFLKYLTPHFSDPQVFAVGCLQKVGKEIAGRGVGKFKKGFLVHGPGSPDKNETLWVFGGAGMFRKSNWEKLGGMDTVYNPFYWEDIDLSYRALKAGYKLVFEPKSIVVHDQEEGAIRNLYNPKQIKTIAYRNQILFVWANISDTVLFLQHLIFLPYHLLRSLLSFDFPFLYAYLWALSRLPQVIPGRIRNERIKQVSDRKLLSSFEV